MSPNSSNILMQVYCLTKYISRYQLSYILDRWIMKNLFKVAKEIEKEKKSKTNSGEMLAEYVGMLQGLTVVHQTAHWTAKGDNYYGEHLLFDRLYENVEEDLDVAAEKLIGVFGSKFMDPKKHAEYTKTFVDECDTKDLTERSLEAEIAFLSFSEEVYDKIKESGDMTLGLDDMIMGIASRHEENVYLLKQQGAKS